MSGVEPLANPAPPSRAISHTEQGIAWQREARLSLLEVIGMRRTFLATLLVAVCAIAVLASSATAKKVPPPPPTTTGVFALAPNDSITLTNMTLTSGDQVVAGACLYLFGQEFSCGEIGVNTPGQTVTLADVSFTNTFDLAVEMRLVLFDATASTQYFSDGTLLSGGVSQPVSHATVGLSADETQTVVSINDGSENTLTAWEPTLGEGSFNASVQLTPAPPTGWTITAIKAYSNGPIFDEAASAYVCSFHTVITYTGDKVKKEKALAGYTAAVALFKVSPVQGGVLAEVPLGLSPFDTGVWDLGGSNIPAGDYAFAVAIKDSAGTVLASQVTSTFTLADPTTYEHGCPPADEDALASFGE